MVDMAIKDFFPPEFPVKVNRIEVDNGESIPTAYLMDKLDEQYADQCDLYFIMGSDLIEHLHWWDDGERMIETMKTIIFRRKGYDNEALTSHPNFPKNNRIVVQEELSLIGVISSTEIRKRVRQNSTASTGPPGLGIAGLVTPNVLNLISTYKMYTEFSKPIDLHVN
jgi:nicotinic acid mononucleotide adenylyltransferase